MSKKEKPKTISETTWEKKGTSERLVLKHEVDVDDDATIDAYLVQSTGTMGWDLIFYRRTHGGKEYILKMPAKAFDKKNWMLFTGDLPANGKMQIPYKFGTRLFRHFKKEEDVWRDKCLALEAHLKIVQRSLEHFLRQTEPAANPNRTMSEFREGN